ncbi:MAG: hypothetical protein EKK57_07930 [Proteobacteria bacterium]|nr:MAG: hypothetical protein EKK57_07930 [Pseudomonadota bacterium]
MIDITQKLPDFEFKQDSQVYAIVSLDGTLTILPTLIVGNVTTVLLPKKYQGRQVPIIAYSYRSAVIKLFPTSTEAEAAFRDMAALNMSNMFYCYANNVFIEEDIRASLNGEENSGIAGIRQEFIDFLAAVVNEMYKSGTSPLFLLDELKMFVGYLLQYAEAQHLIYMVMAYTTPAVKRFNELYLNAPPVEEVPTDNLSDETLDFINGLF